MTCMLCRTADTEPGETTVVLERGSTTVIVKGVPARICANCGEPYVAESASEWLLEAAEAAVARGAEVEILRYAA